MPHYQIPKKLLFFLIMWVYLMNLKGDGSWLLWILVDMPCMQSCKIWNWRLWWTEIFISGEFLGFTSLQFLRIRDCRKSSKRTALHSFGGIGYNLLPWVDLNSWRFPRIEIFFEEIDSLEFDIKSSSKRGTTLRISREIVQGIAESLSILMIYKNCVLLLNQTSHKPKLLTTLPLQINDGIKILHTLTHYRLGVDFWFLFTFPTAIICLINLIFIVFNCLTTVQSSVSRAETESKTSINGGKYLMPLVAQLILIKCHSEVNISCLCQNFYNLILLFLKPF